MTSSITLALSGQVCTLSDVISRGRDWGSMHRRVSLSWGQQYCSYNHKRIVNVTSHATYSQP